MEHYEKLYYMCKGEGFIIKINCMYKREGLHMLPPPCFGQLGSSPLGLC